MRASQPRDRRRKIGCSHYAKSQGDSGARSPTNKWTTLFAPLGSICFQQQSIDTSSPTGKLTFAIFSALMRGSTPNQFVEDAIFQGILHVRQRQEHTERDNLAYRKVNRVKMLVGLFFVACLVFSGNAASAPEDDVKAVFDRFVAAQNAHDANAVRELLLDSPNFLWITRGITVWGRDAAIKRFETLYQGTWHLAPDSSTVKIFMLSETAAQLYAVIMFTVAAPRQPAEAVPALMNQTYVKTLAGWRIASLLPIQLPPPAPPPAPAPAPAPAK